MTMIAIKPHQKIPEMPLISNLAPQRIYIKQEMMDLTVGDYSDRLRRVDAISPESDHSYELNDGEPRMTVIDEDGGRFEGDVHSDNDNDGPLDLRVNLDRGASPHRDRDSGTESDDTDDKLMIQDDADCKPYKKNLIKRCKSAKNSFFQVHAVNLTKTGYFYTHTRFLFQLRAPEIIARDFFFFFFGRENWVYVTGFLYSRISNEKYFNP